jgi:DNA-directed RNA polymerase specialized sigma24 family protein
VIPAISPVSARRRIPSVEIEMRARRYTTVEELERRRGPLPAHDRQIAFLYLDLGLSAAECGRRLYLSQTAVLRRLAAHGIARRPPGGSRPTLTSRQIERAVFLYHRLGLSLSKVASLEGVHPNAVRHRLLAAGVELRSQGAPRRAA